MRLPGRMERYVLARTLRSLAGAMALISAVVVLVDFVSTARDIGSRTDVGFVQMVGLTLLQAPSTILTLTPFAFLFGTLAAFVSMNRSSELIAMRAAGVSAWRFIAPAAAAAFVAGGLVVTVLNPLSAALTGEFETRRDMAMRGYLDEEVKPRWLRQGDSETQVVIRARRQDRAGGALRLQGVSVFVYSRENDGVMRFTRRIEAAEARLEAGFWRLTDVREAVPGSGAIQSETVTIPSNLDPAQAAAWLNANRGAAFWRLPRMILQARDAGFSSVGYELSLQQLFATPLLFAAMAILAAAFSLRLMRLGGIAGLAGAGVGLGFAFFFFNEVCAALGRAEVVSPAAAAWTPPLLALLAGVTLLCHTEDG
jgi:lipopolysaccharide export system permease protein